jgi:hypothetical protein
VGWGAGGEMTQTMYAHVNKRIKKTKQNKTKSPCKTFTTKIQAT